MALKTCTRPAGSVAAYAHIQIRLSQDTVITASGLNYLASPVDITAAADGSVSVQLQANNDLTPNNTYYTVTEYAGSTDSTYYVQVPQTAGPFVLTAIQVSVPPAPAPVGAAHVASLLVDGAATVGGALEALSSTSIAMLATNQTITGVKHFSAAPVFDAGFSVSAGAVTFSVAPTFSLGANFPSGAGVVAMGSGDDVAYYVNGAAWEMTSQQGTAGSPITTGAGPNIKISRTESILAATMPAGIGANNQGNAALWANAIGDASNQAQVSALLGTAVTQSTQVRSSLIDPDACAVQGLAAVQGSGVGRSIGGYFHARRDTNTGTANGAEIRSSNFTATPGTYNATGASDTMGIWVTAGGNVSAINGLGIGFGPGNGTSQFDVGIGFTTLSGVSSVVTTTISDDTTATTSLAINGTHTNAIRIAAGAGGVWIGGTAQVQSPSLLEVQGPNASTDPLVVFGSVGNNQPYTMRIRNSSGQFTLGVATAGTFFTGTLAGDGIITASTTGKAVHLGGTTKVLTVTRANTFGAFAATPVAQQATTGTTTGFTAGAGTAMNSASTSTGGSGATAYTFGDLVLALKNYGWLAA